MSYDTFVAELECPQCGSLSPPDGSTGMQTYIRSDPQRHDLGVGDAVEVDLADSGMLEIRPAEEPLHLLVPWECPACGASSNWAEIVIEDGVIAAIEAVALDAASFARAHSISRDCDSLAAELAGVPIAEMALRDPLPILREAFERD